jgi:hypothetical protein
VTIADRMQAALAAAVVLASVGDAAKRGPLVARTLVAYILAPRSPTVRAASVGDATRHSRIAARSPVYVMSTPVSAPVISASIELAARRHKLATHGLVFDVGAAIPPAVSPAPVGQSTGYCAGPARTIVADKCASMPPAMCAATVCNATWNGSLAAYPGCVGVGTTAASTVLYASATHAPRYCSVKAWTIVVYIRATYATAMIGTPGRDATLGGGPSTHLTIVGLMGAAWSATMTLASGNTTSGRSLAAWSVHISICASPPASVERAPLRETAGDGALATRTVQAYVGASCAASMSTASIVSFERIRRASTVMINMFAYGLGEELIGIWLSGALASNRWRRVFRRRAEHEHSEHEDELLYAHVWLRLFCHP